jgi:hypothetical protein
MVHSLRRPRLASSATVERIAVPMHNYHAGRRSQQQTMQGHGACLPVVARTDHGWYAPLWRMVGCCEFGGAHGH